jgi:hypothetical protein
MCLPLLLINVVMQGQILHHINILLGDFSANMGRENIFKSTVVFRSSGGTKKEIVLEQ